MPFIDTISQQRAARLAVYGLSCLFFLTIVSLLSVNVFGYRIVLTGLPLIGVFLWPRLADGLITVVGIFLIGLWMDLIGEAALGYWPFILLSVFLVLRPDRRDAGQGLIRLWLGFALVAVLTALWMVGVAIVVAGARPDITTIVLDWLPVIALFPLVYAAFRAIGRASSDSSGAGFAL